LTVGKPRQNDSENAKPMQSIIRKPNLSSVAHATPGQKRKDLSPVNPGK